MKTVTKQKTLFHYFLLILVMVLAACANIVTPTGGDKDITPPAVVISEPLNRTINFTSSSIRISFSEFVKLSDFTNQFIISPLMDNPPEIKEKGKTIVLTFKDKLLPQTTYTLYFGKSIVDITEGNALTNYQYVFSTGNTIDSLTIRGKVNNAFDLKPEAGVFVMLYDKNIDSLPLTQKPQYICKTSTAGLFELNNLKSGTYKIFALKDVNANYMFDLPNEKIAFLPDLIIPEIPIVPIKDTVKKDSLKIVKDSIILNTVHPLFLFDEADTVQKLLKSSIPKLGKLTLIFKQAVNDFQLRSLRPEPTGNWFKTEMCPTKDTLNCWFLPGSLDSLFLEVSDNNIVLDTLKFSLVSIEKQSKSGKGTSAVNKLYLGCNAKEGFLFDLNIPIKINCSNPIDSIDFLKIKLMEGKDTLKPLISFTNNIKNYFTIDYKWKEEKSYKLFIPPSVMKDMFDFKNDSVSVKFTTKALRNYGTMSLKILMPAEDAGYIIQLRDENDQLVKEKYIESLESLTFDYLTPKNYKIKLIIDSNHNKKWDTGNYNHKKQAERVYYYPEPINLKANWEMNLDWNILP